MSTREDIEQWFRVRAQWVVDLLRSGMSVAVIGPSGMGKSTTMDYAEQMLAEHGGLAERVRFFGEWKGSYRLPRRAPGELFVVEVSRFRDIPVNFAVVPVIPARGLVDQDDRQT
jgi:hypothetical protein